MKRQNVNWLIGLALLSLAGCVTPPAPPPVVCACDDTVAKLAGKTKELHKALEDLGNLNERVKSIKSCP